MVKSFVLGEPTVRGDFEGIAVLGESLRIYALESDPTLLVDIERPDGSEVAFDVSLNTNEGIWNGTFSQKVGLPLPGGAGTFSENFNAGAIPAGWSVVDGSADGETWFADGAADPAGCGNDGGDRGDSGDSGENP